MTNPLRGVLLDGKFYNYVPSGYRESINIANEVTDTITNRSILALGTKPRNFTLEVLLENTYQVRDGDVSLGSTTWLGLSRLSYLEGNAGATNANLPLTFVTPYGATYNVVMQGMLDINIFNPDNPSPNSCEFSVLISLAEYR